jgi:large subunit ribosomal protein L11
VAKKIIWLHQVAGAGRARQIPSPPIGPALGQRGLNIMEFCKAFNAQTQKAGAGLADTRRDYRLFADKSFTFIMKTPPVGGADQEGHQVIQKGSAKPHTAKVGTLTRAQCEAIAAQKLPDLTAADMEAAVRTIAGSARTMGVTVEGV